jgi:flagellar biosynthesis/type III secretory pathway M-ring protein FliF/YscJ
MKTFKIPRKILIVGLLFFLMISLIMSYLYLVEKNRNANMLLYENSSLIKREGSSISKEDKEKMFNDARENALEKSILTISGINEVSVEISNINTDEEVKVTLLIEIDKNIKDKEEKIKAIRMQIIKSIENLIEENITIITLEGKIMK